MEKTNCASKIQAPCSTEFCTAILFAHARAPRASDELRAKPEITLDSPSLRFVEQLHSRRVGIEHSEAGRSASAKPHDPRPKLPERFE